MIRHNCLEKIEIHSHAQAVIVLLFHIDCVLIKLMQDSLTINDQEKSTIHRRNKFLMTFSQSKIDR